MPILFEALGPMAALASGVSIASPLSPKNVKAIEGGMDQFGVLVFKNQPLTQDQQIDFARCFGPLDIGFGKVKTQGAPHRLKYRELGDTHYSEAQRKAIAPSHWPLVQTDRRTGRKILFVGAHASEIVGMSVAEGRMLLMDLLEHATQRAFVYRHVWTTGDLVMWDNTATVHRGRHFDFSKKIELRRSITEENGL